MVHSGAILLWCHGAIMQYVTEANTNEKVQCNAIQTNAMQSNATPYMPYAIQCIVRQANATQVNPMQNLMWIVDNCRKGRLGDLNE